MTAEPKASRIGVITVTHNNQSVIGKCVESLARQTRPADEVVLIDSGSQETDYVRKLAERPGVRALYEPTDVGFCRGNNIAAEGMLDRFDYIVFLNPDAFLSAEFLAQAEAVMARPENARVGVLTGTLLGYDISADRPTGLYDCTGIYQNWYGRWCTRDQGSPVRPEPPADGAEDIPAICGALMFCRAEALRQTLLRGREIFDEQFFMWKDDIDLSLRIRRAGWRLAYCPGMWAYHCRGWNRDRKKMPRFHRLLSSRNDIRLCVRNRSPYLPYALVKYLYVRFLERG